MKKICYLIILFCVFQMEAQDPELLTNNWYLEKLIINSIDFFPPNSNCSSIGELIFNNNQFQVNHPCCEEECVTSINYDSSVSFDLSGTIACLIDSGCPSQDIRDYTNLHLDNYFDNFIGFYNPYSYEIISAGDNLQLTITNGNGDAAVYNNVLLNAPQFDESSISLYPNPVKDLLYVENNQPIQQLLFYNALGQQVLSVQAPEGSVSVGSLAKGLYFVEVHTAKGSVIKKMVKE